jgi:nucleoside-diphosphate-sugar epimerase
MRVARRLIATGWTVQTMTRRPDRARQLEKQGIHAIVGDWTDRRALEEIRPVERVLVAVGYDRHDDKSRHSVYVEGLRNALDVISPSSRVVYISSTGVYHQTGGVWVDESAPCRPNREGGVAHLMAEQLLYRRRPESTIAATVVLRLAGIYGPGRVPRVDSIRRGEPIPADPLGYLNLIHVDDAAACVLAAWQHARPERCYLVADGHPVLRGDYFSEIARLTHSPSVRYASEGGTRSDTSKRIWNARMRRHLMPQLQFPSYREGLRDVLFSGEQ